MEYNNLKNFGGGFLNSNTFDKENDYHINNNNNNYNNNFNNYDRNPNRYNKNRNFNRKYNGYKPFNKNNFYSNNRNFNNDNNNYSNEFNKQELYRSNYRNSNYNYVNNNNRNSNNNCYEYKNENIEQYNYYNNKVLDRNNLLNNNNNNTLENKKINNEFDLNRFENQLQQYLSIIVNNSLPLIKNFYTNLSCYKNNEDTNEASVIKNLFYIKLLHIVKSQPIFNIGHKYIDKDYIIKNTFDYFNLTIFDILNKLKYYDYIEDLNYNIEFNEFSSNNLYDVNEKFINKQLLEIVYNYNVLTLYSNDNVVEENKTYINIRRKLKRNNNLNYNYYPVMCSDKSHLNFDLTKLHNFDSSFNKEYIKDFNEYNNCLYSHNEFEINYHPLVYKTNKCSNNSHYEYVEKALESENINTKDKRVILLCKNYHSADDFIFINNLNIHYENKSLRDFMNIIKCKMDAFYLSDINEEITNFYKYHIKFMNDANKYNYNKYKEVFVKTLLNKYSISETNCNINLTKLFKGFSTYTYNLFICPEKNNCDWLKANKSDLCLFYHDDKNCNEDKINITNTIDNPTCKHRRSLKLYQYSHLLCPKKYSNNEENTISSNSSISNATITCNDDFCEYSHNKYEFYYHNFNFRRIKKCLRPNKIKEICDYYITCYGYHSNEHSIFNYKLKEDILNSNHSLILNCCKKEVNSVDLKKTDFYIKENFNDTDYEIHCSNCLI